MTLRVATVAAGSLRSLGGQFLSWGGCSEGDSARGRRLTGGRPPRAAGSTRCCSWRPGRTRPASSGDPGRHSAHLFSGHVPPLLAPFSLIGLPKRFCSLTDRTSNGGKNFTDAALLLGAEPTECRGGRRRPRAHVGLTWASSQRVCIRWDEIIPAATRASSGVALSVPRKPRKLGSHSASGIKGTLCGGGR